MATNVSYNGVTYSIPADGDTGWGPDLTAYFISLAANSLQKSGGIFALTAELGFGASFGIKSLYYKSQATNPSASGVLRLGSAQAVSWRNNANSGDLALTTNSGDALLFNSSEVLLAGLGSIVNADVNAAAGIVYSKLNLSNSILNADINSAAAIAYSKLNLATSIVNADINVAAAIAYSKLNLATSIVNSDIGASAAIAYSKLAVLTVSRALVSDGSGFVSVSSVTSTELGYVSGVTSDIQTQLNSKLGLGTIRTITTTATLNVADDLNLCSASANYTITAYSATGNAGRIFTVKRTDSAPSNRVTVSAGTKSYVLFLQNEFVTFQCTGSDFEIIAKSPRGLFGSAHVSANKSASTTVPIDFDTEGADTHNAITTGASWNFTAPFAGKFIFTYSCLIGAAGTALRVYIGGTFNRKVGYQAGSGEATGAITLNLASGAVVDFRPSTSITVTGGSLASDSCSHMTVSSLEEP